MAERPACSTRALSIAFAALIGFLPYALPVAQAQETLDRAHPESHAVKVHEDASGSHLTARLDKSLHNGKMMTHCSLSTNQRFSEFWFAPEEVSLGDGYGFGSETLADNPAVVVKKLTATAPEGRHAEAIIRLDRQTLSSTTNGLDRVLSLLQESDQFALLKDAIPSLVAAMQGQSSAVHHRATTAADLDADYVYDVTFVMDDIFAGIWGCVGAVLAVVAAYIGLILGCLVPEPAQPLACTAAIIGLVAACAAVLDQC